MIHITRAEAPKDIEAVKALFIEYAESLDFELCFQDFDHEMATFPAKYTPPEGGLLLARDEAGEAVGAVGLWRLGDGICEMKRLYARPASRGKSVGRKLAQAIVGMARDLGYRRMRLDTLPSMVAARKLYETVGFRETRAYTVNPIAGALFMELEL